MIPITALIAPWQPLYSSQKSGLLWSTSGLWDGSPQDFHVQWHEDRVYFRLSEGDSTVWATLDSCLESNAVPCFHEAVARKRYGVCFLKATQVFYGKQQRYYLVLWLQFIFALDGTGLLREWSSQDWIFFAPRETRMWSLSPDLVLTRKNDRDLSWGFCSYAAQSVQDPLLTRHVSGEEIERLRWKSATNEAEFHLVLRLLCKANFLTVEGQWKNWGGISLHTQPAQLQGKISLAQTQWQGSRDLFLWLQRYFVGEGLEWRQTDWGKRRFRKLRACAPHLRAFLELRGINWWFPFDSCGESSWHEQIEARLELRDWLLDKVPNANLEEWTSPVVQD